MWKNTDNRYRCASQFYCLTAPTNIHAEIIFTAVQSHYDKVKHKINTEPQMLRWKADFRLVQRLEFAMANIFFSFHFWDGEKRSKNNAR